MMGREAFQEIDYRHMFGPMAKWVEQIDDPGRIPELVSRAFHVATSGRPGPVVLALPEDMLVEESDVADAKPGAVIRVHPDPARRRAGQRAARRRGAAARRRRRRAVERRGARRSHGLVHRERAPGRLRLAPPGLRRQQLGRLRRPPRARRRPPARTARARRRRPARDRRPAERDHDGGLHAARGAGSGTGAHPRHRRPRRARPGLHAGVGRRGVARCVRPSPLGAAAARTGRARAGDAPGAAGLSRQSPQLARCPATSTWAT